MIDEEMYEDIAYKEMDKDISDICPAYEVEFVVKELYNLGYRKFSEGSVVLSKEVFEDYMRDSRQVEEGAEVCYNCHNEYAEKIDQARKETARDILKEVTRTRLYDNKKECGGKLIGYLLRPEDIKNLEELYQVQVEE